MELQFYEQRLLDHIVLLLFLALLPQFAVPRQERLRRERLGGGIEELLQVESVLFLVRKSLRNHIELVELFHGACIFGFGGFVFTPQFDPFFANDFGDHRGQLLHRRFFQVELRDVADSAFGRDVAYDRLAEIMDQRHLDASGGVETFSSG
ncbi:hypothetical protein L596_014727 [Steinernema carpocapsae]|uniref:Uncharacterized protein n=1 Tax=Steinernema carpocapsae TaxID=34508 RepID=A0A4U5NCR0_STECR|nr:hypothetical protein L596_014727 [Steinernema carpocapsae]